MAADMTDETIAQLHGTHRENEHKRDSKRN